MDEDSAPSGGRAGGKFAHDDRHGTAGCGGDKAKLSRLPGDAVFILGGAIPTLYIAYLGVRYTVKRVTLDEPDDILFTELSAPPGVEALGGDEATAARLT